MKKGLTEIVFILDRSGSMSGLEADTIGGFNSLIEKQKKEEGEAIISTVLFDDTSEVIYDRVDVKSVQPMTDRQYYVRGCTALLDALGGAIKHISHLHKHMPENQRPEKTMFVITTDGMENASQKYTYKKVKKLVEGKQEKHHWEFLFLGANIDAISVASNFGIHKNRAFNYHSDAVGTAVNYSAMSNTISAFRSCEDDAKMDMIVQQCCAPIVQDYNKRSKKKA